MRCAMVSKNTARRSSGTTMLRLVEPGGDARGAQQEAHAARAGAAVHEALHVDVGDVDADGRRIANRLPQVERVALQIRACLDLVLNGRARRRAARGDRATLQAPRRSACRRRGSADRRRAPGGYRGSTGVAMPISIRKRSRAAAGSSNVSSRSMRLRSANTSRYGKVVFAVEGADRALGHQAQQQRMHLRAGAVDLVEEEDGEVAAVADDRAGLDARAAVLADDRCDRSCRRASGRSCLRHARMLRRGRAQPRAAASSCRRRRRPPAARGRARRWRWSAGV